MRFHDYRWQDIVISPGRAAVDLIATLIIIAMVGGASLAIDRSEPDRGGRTAAVASVHEPWPNDPPATRGSELATAVRRRPVPAPSGG
jgi:hypothetical protein